MAPLNGVRKQVMNVTNDGKTPCVAELKPGENGCNEGDSSAPQSATTAAVRGDFISDMLNIRSLATCSICDQLLYEPWTLGCGHTYCYSCLCSWFLPNKRRKTCPDCRTAVKHMPAPAFLLKQMVDIFLKRAELMPVDESTEQHEKRRKEENEIVEEDRSGEAGLFKGCFSSNAGNSIYYDEEDLIRRCSGCGHEYNGGPTCRNCGQEVEEEYDFSNSDDGLSMDSMERDHLAEMEIDMYGEEDDEDEEAEDEGYGYGSPPHWGQAQLVSHIHHYPYHSSAAMDNGTHFGMSDADDSDEEEPTQSEQDFIDDGAANRIPHVHYTASVTSSSLSHESGSSAPLPSTEDGNDSDEQDEGGDVSNGRRQRARWRVPSSSPSVVTVPSTDASDAGDTAETPAHRESRWSPLDYGNDGEICVRESNSEASDTDTMVGNQESVDDDVERYRETHSSTPRYSPCSPRYEPSSPIYRAHRHNDGRRGMRSASIRSTTSEDYDSFEDDNLDSEGESLVDREGDTEMSVSPTAPPRSNHQRRPSVEILGSATAVHDVESDSSDESVRVPVRRRRGQYSIGGRRYHATRARVNQILILQEAALRDLWARRGSLMDMRVNIPRTGNERRPRPPAGYHNVPNGQTPRPPAGYRIVSPRRAVESRHSWISPGSSGSEIPGRIRRQYRGFMS